MNCKIERISTLNMSREDWLGERKKGIGGSDAAAILGMNRYRSAFDVYADKLDIAPKTPDNEAMKQGRDLEEYVARRFSEETGKKVRRENAILYNPFYPFARANIDRAVVGEKAGLECKTTSVLNLKRYKNGDFPEEYYVQCMHYLMVTGFERWYLAVLVFGTDFKVFTIERDEGEIKALAEAERSFWENNVQKNNPPSPAGTDATEETIKHLYPNGTDNRVDLSGFDAEIKRLADVRKFKAQYEKEQKALEQKIKLYMGDCSYGTSDLYSITYKEQERPSYDTEKIIADFVPEGTDLSDYITRTKTRVFRMKTA
ncbi:MAG: YqaJ viral recombinase family protein [Candidatus Ornithomonoglobus sp.]